MSDEVQIEGIGYISSKRAAELSGYAQDYIGQLARKGLVDARRIGGLWYLSLASLQTYQKKAEEFKPEPPQRPEVQEPGTLIFFDGKEYLSAARAAEVTGYTQDYVGQLARGGSIQSRQVGNRWYVERGSILAHKREKDALLAAVQSESVGLKRPSDAPETQPKYQANVSHYGYEPMFKYSNDSGDLMPVLSESRNGDNVMSSSENLSPATKGYQPAMQTIAIKRITPDIRPARVVRTSSKALFMPAKRESSFMPLLLGAAATIVILVSVGYASLLRQDSVYAVNIRSFSGVTALPASVDMAFNDIGSILEPYLTHELTYVRSDSQQ